MTGIWLTKIESRLSMSLLDLWPDICPVVETKHSIHDIYVNDVAVVS